MIPEEGYYQPDVFPWDGGHEPSEELVFMKKKVVPFLLNHPYSGPFRYPVNAKAEGIYPDYFKVGAIYNLGKHLPETMRETIEVICQ